jgi:hypothetical protein
MAEGAGRERWGHTSAILALIANVNRDPKQTPAFKPADFDPYRGRSDEKVISVAELKGLFVRPGRKR